MLYLKFNVSIKSWNDGTHLHGVLELNESKYEVHDGKEVRLLERGVETTPLPHTVVLEQVLREVVHVPAADKNRFY